MKTFVMILLSAFAFSAQANQTCISQEEAREIMLRQDQTILKQMKQKIHVGLCKGRPNQGCVTKTHLTQVLLRTAWNERHQVYMSGSLHYWLCGPGADCWEHATLSCSGELKLLTVGD